MKPRSRAGLTSRPTGDGFAVLDADGTVMLELDASDASIWALCDGTRTPAQIVATIAARRKVEEGLPLVGDVAAAILRFEEEGLLE